MFKLGLKLWSINENYVREAIRLYEQGIYDFIELFAVPGTFSDYINLWKNLKAPFIIHAPHYQQGLNLAKAECFEQNMKFAEETRKYADELNAEYIIYHPGIAGITEETVRQLNIINDSRILVENKPYFTVHNDGVVCNGNSPEEIKFIIDNAGIGFCLDIGHCFASANAQGVKQYDFLNQFLDLKPALFHLTDNDFSSVTDKHLNFGQGNLDIEKILNLLSENAKITLETIKNSKENLDDFVKDIEYIRQFDFEILKATEADMMDVFHLSNDSVVRANSFNPEPIQLEEHKNWFSSKINSEEDFFYVIKNNQTGKLIAYIRYEKIENDESVVSIAISPEFRGKNYGAKFLKQISLKIINEKQIKKINAYVKPENIESIKTFEKAGYTLVQNNSEKILLEMK